MHRSDFFKLRRARMLLQALLSSRWCGLYDLPPVFSASAAFVKFKVKALQFFGPIVALVFDALSRL